MYLVLTGWLFLHFSFLVRRCLWILRKSWRVNSEIRTPPPQHVSPHSLLCPTVSLTVVYIVTVVWIGYCCSIILWKTSKVHQFKMYSREFPGGPAAKTVLPTQGAQVWSLVRELHGMAKNFFFLINSSMDIYICMHPGNTTKKAAWYITGTPEGSFSYAPSLTIPNPQKLQPLWLLLP